jgi:trehalose 6-phosphate phosphatase
MTIEIVEPGAQTSALEKWEEIAERLRDSDPVIFLDYDGTLAPVASVPSQPVLSDRMRSTLRRLVKLCPVALVSGRDLRDLRRRVGLKDVVYLASGGLEAHGPLGRYVQAGEESFAPSLNCAESDLRFAIGNIRGALVERRTFSVAMHHRLVDPKDMPRLMDAFDDVARRHPELKVVRGKRALELRAHTEWDRGRAVELVVAKLRLRDAMPVYIGDDRTDEAAFEAIGEKGITILVAEDARETAAQYVLSDYEEVRQFLEHVIEVLEEQSR